MGNFVFANIQERFGSDVNDAIRVELVSNFSTSKLTCSEGPIEGVELIWPTKRQSWTLPSQRVATFSNFILHVTSSPNHPLVKHLQNVNYQRKNIRSERRRNLLTHKKSTQTRRALAPSLNSFFTRKFSHENDKYFNYDASTKKLFIFVAFNHFDLSSFARTQRDQRLLMFSSPEFLRLRRLRPKVWSVSISKKSFMFRLSGDHFQERLIRNLIAMNFLYNSRKSSALISWDLFCIVERLKTVFWDV